MRVKILKWAFVIIIVISLCGFLYQSDFGAIMSNLSDVGFDFVWLILVTFLAQIFGTLSWIYTLPQTSSVSYKKLFLIRYIGEHIGLINPANFVGGDAFKAYMLEKDGIPYDSGISSLLVSRFIMIYVQVVIFLLAALLYLLSVGSGTSFLVQVIGISIVFLAVTLGLLFLSDRILNRNVFNKKGISKNIRNIRAKVWNYYKNDGRRFLMSIFWSAINFLVGAIEIWLICHFIGLEITYLEALLIDQGVLFLKSFAAFIPGQIGVEEYTNKIMLNIIGITSMSLWLSVSILRRARQVFWILLAVVLYYLILDNRKKVVICTPQTFVNIKA